jgi:hypothetical protein
VVSIAAPIRATEAAPAGATQIDAQLLEVAEVQVEVAVVKVAEGVGVAVAEGVAGAAAAAGAEAADGEGVEGEAVLVVATDAKEAAVGQETS